MSQKVKLSVAPWILVYIVVASLQRLRKTCALIVGLLLLACQANAIKPFHSDGCSLFPDTNIITKQDWCECCYVHDLAYWQGGTQEQRLEADQQLRECVLAKTHDEILAKVMYEGVRFGGSPYFYNWYRWGYGWPYSRKYQALTEDEIKLVATRLEEYKNSAEPKVCPVPKSDN